MLGERPYAVSRRETDADGKPNSKLHDLGAFI